MITKENVQRWWRSYALETEIIVLDVSEYLNLMFLLSVLSSANSISSLSVICNSSIVATSLIIWWGIKSVTLFADTSNVALTLYFALADFRSDFAWQVSQHTYFPDGIALRWHFKQKCTRSNISSKIAGRFTSPCGSTVTSCFFSSVWFWSYSCWLRGFGLFLATVSIGQFWHFC